MRKCIESDRPLSKIIEQFVKLNHQMGKQIDEQCKRIVSAEIMANSMAKRKALDYHCKINKRIKLVHDAEKRGEYEKEVPIMPTDNHPPPSSMVATPQAKETTVNADGKSVVIREMLDFKRECLISRRAINNNNNSFVHDFTNLSCSP